MSRWIVDASVAIKWFLREVHSDDALRLLSPRHELWAPDLLWPEVGSAIWKRVRRDELEMGDASEIIRLTEQSPIETRSSAELLDSALRIAVSLGLTVYDSLYIALSIASGAPLVTADSRLHKTVDRARGPRVIWVGDVP